MREGPEYKMMPGGKTWQRSDDLRVARNASHIGRPERLQQRWWCRETGESKWQDVPVVEVSD